jgi:hypothetical protein
MATGPQEKTGIITKSYAEKMIKRAVSALHDE